MTHIEIVSPCCLHLGFVQFEGEPCRLTIALQHPFLQFTVSASDDFFASGPCADTAIKFAERYLSNEKLPHKGLIEIEEAVPAFMGIGSDALLEVNLTIAFAELNDQEPYSEMLEASKGGLSLFDSEGHCAKRALVKHADEEAAWVFILVLPKPADEIEDDHEWSESHNLWRAGQNTNHDSETYSRQLFLAVEQNDFKSFASTLANIHSLNEEALAQTGTPRTPSPGAKEILQLMRDNGALMCAQTLTGLGLYGLIQGSNASRKLRAALSEHLGYFGPLVMATICDNEGARIRVIG